MLAARFWLPLLALGTTTACAAAGQPPDVAEIDGVLTGIYGHYARDDASVADWDRPVFTAANRKLIADWQALVGDELAGLNEYGWFCEYQDCDAGRFRTQRRSVRNLGNGRVEVGVRVSAGWGAPRDQRLVLVREGGRWLIEDLFSRSEPGGIRKALRRDLAEKPGG